MPPPTCCSQRRRWLPQLGDNETDSYIPPTTEVPFTVPHLHAPLSITGPLITGFPLPVRALMDIGCPYTVISLELCETLGLRRYKLPKREDNLSSLMNSPLTCTKYVKLEVVSLPTQTHDITYTHALTRATHAPTRAHTCRPRAYTCHLRAYARYLCAHHIRARRNTPTPHTPRLWP
jgi:hypothetical protein